MFHKLVVVLLLVSSGVALADKPTTFSQAKRVLADEVYGDYPVTFYCGCDFADAPVPNKPNRTRLTPDPKRCGLKPRKNANRSGRIEWEHIVPAYEFGHQLLCWQQGGRKACQKDPKFNEMESDMMNLVPAVGELNGDRSNFRYGMIDGEPRAYGRCDFEVDFKGRVAEPRREIRGDIARTYFYMAEKYGLKIGRKQRQMFEVWDRQDPIDDWEAQRKLRIQAITGEP